MLDHQLQGHCQETQGPTRPRPGAQGMDDGSDGGTGGQMRADGRMNHGFQGPTMACDHADMTQDPYDEAWDDVSGKKLGPGAQEW
eukprot:1401340-Alexandrium_andersonii.AAC.1